MEPPSPQTDPPFPSAGRGPVGHELARLRDRRAELAASLAGDADSGGDSADAADRLERQADLARIDDRIAELVELLEGGPTPPPAGELPDGTTVAVRFSDGRTDRVRVVAMVDEVSATTSSTAVTADSPLGRALAGARPGDTITYWAPDGEDHAEVLEMHPPAGT